VVPPVPVHERLKTVVAVNAPVDCGPPLVETLPVQFVFVGLALAVQLVAFVVDQVRVVLAPLAILLEAALSVTLGAGVTGVVVGLKATRKVTQEEPGNVPEGIVPST
jgi:hypothetical protein